MAKSAILKVDIISDARKASAGFDSTASKIKKFQKNLDKAALVAGGALAGVGALAKSFFDAAEASGTADARIGNIVNSMGNFGAKHQQVSDRIVESANKMARSTGIDPNAIKQGQAILSTFDTIVASADQVGGAFDRATKLSADLSAAGFGSVESSAQMLGKALADPTRGMTALRRVGVNLTAQQEEQVKAMQAAGDMAGAQNVILSAVEKQVGGTAEATANASDKAKVAWQQAKEKLGETLMPAFERLTQAVEHASDFIGKHSGAVATFMGIVAGLAAVIITASAAMKVYAAAQTAVAVAKGVATAAQWALNVAMSANPIGLIIIGIAALIAFIAALVAGIIWAWKNVEWFRNGIITAWERIKTASIAVWDFIKTAIGAAWQAIVWVFQNLSPVGIIITHWETIKTATANAWNAVKTWISNTWNAIVRGITTKITQAAAAISAGWAYSKALTQAAWRAMLAHVIGGAQRVVSTVRSIPGRIRSALGNLGSLLVNSGRQLMEGFARGIRNAASRAVNAAKNAVKQVRDFFPFSPARKGPFSGTGYTTYSGSALVSDFAKAMTGELSTVRRAAGRVAAAGTFEAGYDITAAARARTASGKPETHVHIHIDGAFVGDRVSLARELQAIFNDYETVMGRPA